jgi:predicted MFS family arabinose efflux permease
MTSTTWAGTDAAQIAARGATAADRAARRAVSIVFFLCGAGTANWVVRIPAVRAALGLSNGTLGIALLGVAVGAVLTMPLTGRLVARYGSRPVTRVAAVLFAISLALPPLAPSLPLLVAALLALGAGSGMLDVSMNAQAAAVERRYERPLMSGFHALFSFGGLVGAALGGLVADRGVAPVPHLAVVALLCGALGIWVTRALLPAHEDAAPEHASFRRPSRALLALGVIAFCVLFGEGAMADWTAVFLRDVSGVGAGLAAAGYAAFSLAMAGGRAVGDLLTMRLGRERLVRGGGALAALGVAIAVVGVRPWAAIVGFAMVGAGLSTVFPTVLARAAVLPGQAPGAAIATVSTFGYAGFLAGPPLIGFVADALTLRGGLAIVALTSLTIVALAGRGRTTRGDRSG